MAGERREESKPPSTKKVKNMASRRTQKVAEALREVVSMAILAELKDPRVRDVTVTYVEVAGDLRQAKVHVSIMGDEKCRKLCLYGLQSSAGFLQAKCSERIDMRYTPRLTFILDQGVKHSIEISRILSEVLSQDEKKNAPSDTVPTDDVAPADGVVPTSEEAGTDGTPT